ncbi:hypothetical protein [Moorena sp. SIO3I6]|uniref:hypothetical protein n=1 Tax=Moorena sp. SIO3I6 TaxID=2607831 RepID=UPI0013F93BCA|nr:hypothetical protein [Moorena sp. SIO3I6]NEP21898.1 hypothetical protein [Moorena sp. SIO3I6]
MPIPPDLEQARCLFHKTLKIIPLLSNCLPKTALSIKTVRSTPTKQPNNLQPSTFNLQPNNLQPSTLAKGHATRTTLIFPSNRINPL